MVRTIEDIEADLKKAQEDLSYLEASTLKEFEKLRYERINRIHKLIGERNRYWCDYERSRIRQMLIK